MGMGFGIGNAFNQQAWQMAGVMNPTQTPPPPPTPTSFSPYYLFINNAQQGPFDLATLSTLASTGILTPQTMVWKQGMTAWAPASNQPDLASLFRTTTTPPPPPIMP